MANQLPHHPPHRVLIAGGGIAGLEAFLALHGHAGDRVALTLLSPSSIFSFRALSVTTPFGRPDAHCYDVAAIAAEHGATFVHAGLQAVEPENRVVVTDHGGRIAYDSLLIAAGAEAHPVYAEALTFGGPRDAAAMRRLVRDVEAGLVSRIAFVVPPRGTWTLPLYELALLMASRAHHAGLHTQLTIVTPEDAPLGMFGKTASDRIEQLLHEAGVHVRTNCHTAGVADGAVLSGPSRVEVRAERVVALPRLEGPAIAGLPSDSEGFLPVDEYARVSGVEGVFGAGDCTTVPIKQGGLAAQQAGVAARSIAADAGLDVRPLAFRPVLNAKLLGAAGPVYLREPVAGGGGSHSSAATSEALWWPPSKVAAPHLARYLEKLDGRHRHPHDNDEQESGERIGPVA